MSSPDGPSSDRLSDALDRIFSRFDEPADDRADDRADDDLADVDDPDAPFEFPQIVPATTDGTNRRDDGDDELHVDERRAGTLAAPTLPGEVRTSPSVTSTPLPTSTSTATPAAVASRPATGWADHMHAVPTNRGVPLRNAGRRPRVRRVTRVVRHVDPWSVFKVGLLFSLVSYVVALTSGVLLWRVADSTGTIANVERWFTQFGWETFELQGGEIFDNAWVIGLFGVVGTTGGLVLLATLFNLVSDIVGGVRVTVLEEEVVERTVTSTRRYVVRQGPTAAAAPAPDWDLGDDEAGAAPPSRSTSGTGRVEPATSPAEGPRSVSARTPAGSGGDDWSVDDD